jgi:hypothetical protein
MSGAIVEFRGLDNVRTVMDGVFSGSEPHGRADFDSLVALDVRTVISVDGAAPDASLAAQYGLKYIHIPVSYGQISESKGHQIARAIRDLPGPVYVHCQHGQHRAPSAAAFAAVVLGRWTPEDAVTFMQRAGTSLSYQGLYDSVMSARHMDDAALDGVPLPSTDCVPPTGMVELMVSLDREFHRLQSSDAVGWRVPHADPDLDPARTAQEIIELFKKLGGGTDNLLQQVDFVRRLDKAKAASRRLSDALGDRRLGVASDALKELKTECSACHDAFRGRR